MEECWASLPPFLFYTPEQNISATIKNVGGWNIRTENMVISAVLIEFKFGPFEVPISFDNNYIVPF